LDPTLHLIGTSVHHAQPRKTIVTQPNLPNDDRIDDLEQKPVDGDEAEKVKGGANASAQPTLIRVPTARKAEPCFIVPCI
jgi:hypothetical protein